MAFLWTSLQPKIGDKLLYNIHKHMGKPWALTKKAFRGKHVFEKFFNSAVLKIFQTFPLLNRKIL